MTLGEVINDFILSLVVKVLPHERKRVERKIKTFNEMHIQTLKEMDEIERRSAAGIVSPEQALEANVRKEEELWNQEEEIRRLAFFLGIPFETAAAL
ncbi:MAG: hypothetical protein ABA06_03320 [Parcubacteria bacterium C7867-001]|nr:MAG: hypothetical protein ABA06_03320 [Parcubacteria bacterium C7867-001]